MFWIKVKKVRWAEYFGEMLIVEDVREADNVDVGGGARIT